MNKYLIILMAICLVNVHAFVKRDAPATASPSTLDDLTKQFNDVKDKLMKSIDPEEIKKLLSSSIDSLNKGIEDLKNKFETPAEKKA